MCLCTPSLNTPYCGRPGCRQLAQSMQLVLEHYMKVEDCSIEIDKATGDAHDPVVRSVIEQLDKDVVSSGDRAKLRGAVNGADQRAEKNDKARGVFERITNSYRR